MPYILDALVSDQRVTRRVGLKALLWLSVEYDDESAAERQNLDWVNMWGWWN
jgi:hypothetical protein